MFGFKQGRKRDNECSSNVNRNEGTHYMPIESKFIDENNGANYDAGPISRKNETQIYNVPGYAFLQESVQCYKPKDWDSSRQFVPLREAVLTNDAKPLSGNLSWVIGMDKTGEIIHSSFEEDISLLIFGDNNTGKSKCLDNIIINLILRLSPDNVQLIMIDYSPEMCGLKCYNNLPHLRIPITSGDYALSALNALIREKKRRQTLIATNGQKTYQDYNAVQNHELLKPIVLVVNDLNTDEDDAIILNTIQNIVTNGRIVGIYTIFSLKGLSIRGIKRYNSLINTKIIGRLSESVARAVEIKEAVGLSEEGDLLYKKNGYPKPVRVQGCFVSDDEIAAVTDFWKKQGGVSQEEMARQNRSWMNDPVEREHPVEDERDELFIKAADYIIDSEKASIGNLQRIFRIGFNRAARLMDQLADAGIVGKDNGTKSREIMMDAVQFADWKHENGYD